MKGKSLLLPIVTLLSLVSCGKDAVPDRAVIDTSKDTFEIGMLQIADVDALNAARESFVSTLKSSPLLSGKTLNFNYRNAHGDDVEQKNEARSLVVTSDLMLGVSTGSSQDLKNARDEAGKKQPILFTAVSDPVAAHLIKAYPHQDGSVTGTSDDNPVEAQIELITKCFTKAPKDIKLAIMYTSSEVNSRMQANRAIKAAKSAGITNVQTKTCTGVSDLASVALNVANNFDVVYIPTDNNIANNMPTVKAQIEAGTKHTLCVVGEEGMLNGGHITYSISYSLLGKRTGEMAAEILSGTKETHEIDVEKMLDEAYLSKVYNSANLAAAGITVPASALEGFTDVALK